MQDFDGIPDGREEWDVVSKKDDKSVRKAWPLLRGLPQHLRLIAKPVKRTLLLIAFVLFATAAWAHQDRILSVNVNGVILELPAAYRTTRLHIAFSGGDAGALQQLNFMSSGRETRIQPCLLQLVPRGSFRQLFLVGSWYHDESNLPHYLQVKFLDETSPRGALEPGGVRFLFSLRDATLLEVDRVVPLPAQNAVQFRKISLSDGCPI